MSRLQQTVRTTEMSMRQADFQDALDLVWMPGLVLRAQLTAEAIFWFEIAAQTNAAMGGPISAWFAQTGPPTPRPECAPRPECVVIPFPDRIKSRRAQGR